MARGKKKETVRKYKNPNGFGTVYKISGNRRKPWIVRATAGWEVTKDSCGKPHKKQQYINIGTTETYEEGVSMLMEYHKKKMTGMEILKDDATFDDIYQVALPRRLKGKSDDLYYIYKSAYKRLSPIKDIPISNIKTGTMQKCIDDVDKEEKKKAPALKGNIKMICKMVFNYAVQNDLATTNYAEYLETGKIEPKKHKVPFSDVELKQLIKHKEDPYIDSIIFLIYTGLRVNEFCKLKIEDVHLKERYLITGSKTDAGKDRVVPIPLPIMRIVEQHINDNRVYLFEKSPGIGFTVTDYRKHIFKPALEKLGIQHNPHECRHTFSTLTDAADMNRVAQQKILGHKGNNVTEKVYIHKNLRMLIEAVDKVWPSEESLLVTC